MQHLPFFNKKNLVILIATISSPSFATDIQEITITASPLNKNADAVSQANNLLQGDELRKSVASNLGETLEQLPGIHSSSFGPGVGIPIIRGQSDNRVKVMQDSIGSMDASAASPDHAISIEPLLANRIEVLRGPAALRYGSGAIGGVVNVFDNRIPDELPEDTEGGVELRYGDANQEQTAVASVTGAVNQFALHWDGVHRQTDDTKIPSYASIKVNPDETTKGFIDNTDSTLNSNSLGVSYIGSDSFLGVAINQLDNTYGIPPDVEENVHIVLKQTRVDVKGELNQPFSGFSKITGRIAFNDYQHIEMEGDEPGSKFTNDAYEGRVELIHNPVKNIKGAVGVQFSNRTFAARNAKPSADNTERDFIPESGIKNVGIFLLEDISVNQWTYETGVRLEKQHINATTSNTTAGEDLSHTSRNISAVANWHFTENQRISFGIARSQRAPSVEELLSLGIHDATQSFLIGDTSLKDETSENIEMGYHWHSDNIEASVNVFDNQVNDYIYAAATGQDEDGLPVFQYTQADAKFTGYESQLTFFLHDHWQWTFSADKVRARLNSGEDLPRMPPMRFSNTIDYTLDKWDASLRVTQVEKQQYPSQYEAATQSYTRWDASISYKIEASKNYLLFLKANNLTNEDIRNATSFLREVAPEAGRNIQLGVRVEF